MSAAPESTTPESMAPGGAPGAVVGVDVGGTFTDLFCFEPATRRFRTAKVPSNRGDEAVGFLQGLRGFGPVAQLASVVHGTTVGTNALLERKGARVGLLTTRGFRDVLEMRRRDRRRTWGLWGDFVPVVDRDMRLEVGERVLADGTVREPVDAEEVRAAVRQPGCDAYHAAVGRGGRFLQETLGGERTRIALLA